MSDLAIRRRVPEILDDLDAHDLRAIASRNDLVRLNALMLHAGFLTRALNRHVIRPPERMLEIGAGDGTLMLKVARRLAPRWPGVRLVLLDRQNLVPGERIQAFAALGWQAETVTSDLFQWLSASREERFDVVMANLFLHHFDDADLVELMSGLAGMASVFVATEPRRNTASLAASRMLRAIGANEVTRHDAPASVRAGFQDGELTRLWPGRPGDRIEEWRAGLFTHAFAVSQVDGGDVP